MMPGPMHAPITLVERWARNDAMEDAFMRQEKIRETKRQFIRRQRQKWTARIEQAREAGDSNALSWAINERRYFR